MKHSFEKSVANVVIATSTFVGGARIVEAELAELAKATSELVQEIRDSISSFHPSVLADQVRHAKETQELLSPHFASPDFSKTLSELEPIIADPSVRKHFTQEQLKTFDALFEFRNVAGAAVHGPDGKPLVPVTLQTFCPPPREPLDEDR